MGERQTVSEVEIGNCVARGVVYNLLACAFLYPDEELIGAINGPSLLREAALIHLQSEADRLDTEFLPRWTALKSFLERESLMKLQEEYLRVFSLTISKECPPYETEYGQAHIFQQTQRMSDIAGFYRAFGLQESRRRPDRCDHISTELEFMYFLNIKKTYALSRYDREHADICANAERSFLLDHVGWWVPSFTFFLERKAGQGYLRLLALLTRVFINNELRAQGIQPEQNSPNPRLMPTPIA